MSNLVITLGLGSAALALLFFLIYKFTRLRAYHASAVVVAIMLFVFVPASILTWQSADVFAIHLALYIIVPYGLGIVFSQKEAEAASGKAHIGRLHWAPMVIVGFFTIIATVQAVLITLAHNGMPDRFIGTLLPEPDAPVERVTSAFPGLVDGFEDRDQALAVHRMTELEQQAARGWEIRQGWVSEPQRGETETLRVEVRDGNGRPLEGAEVSGTFLWLPDHRQDQRFDMREEGDGFYEIDVALPEAGRWDLRFFVQHEGVQVEQQARTRVHDRSG
ncbi:FixH family protein [Thioalkalivibrio sp. ALJ24]|uniref:FixH family protein n=1 Tax=Thioalkalivibrio sp. ALJ24 TaxID=545276 RepID=UPI0003656C80|nr:FixH family protein [Thioalkalivibrio sp. ALJ24]